jgi:hypothetical protein
MLRRQVAIIILSPALLALVRNVAAEHDRSYGKKGGSSWPLP